MVHINKKEGTLHVLQRHSTSEIPTVKLASTFSFSKFLVFINALVAVEKITFS